MKADLIDFRFKMTRCTSRTLSYFEAENRFKIRSDRRPVVEGDAHKHYKIKEAHMKFRPLGDTDINVSELCLGTMTWESKTPNQSSCSAGYGPPFWNKLYRHG